MDAPAKISKKAFYIFINIRTHMYSIADITIDLKMDGELVHDRFLSFAVKDSVCDLIYEVSYETLIIPGDYIRVKSLTNRSIYYNKKNWILTAPEKEFYPYAILANGDWSRVRLYVTPESLEDLHKRYSGKKEKEAKKTLLLRAIRELFRFSVLKREGVYLHAVLLEAQGKGIAFSAPSGTGKTTHTNFWEEENLGRIVNGDNCVIRFQEDRLYAYGLPWCGSSGIYLNERLPFLGCVFLEQSPYNEGKTLKQKDAFFKYLQTTYLPRWDRDLTDCAMQQIEKIAAASESCLLRCRPEKESVGTVRKCLKL